MWVVRVGDDIYGPMLGPGAVPTTFRLLPR